MQNKLLTTAFFSAIFAVLSVALLSSAVVTSPAVQDISVMGEIQGDPASLVSDSTVGICRYMTFENSNGYVDALLCDKEDQRYELYLQDYKIYSNESYYPHAFKVFISKDENSGEAYIDERRGFVSFTSADVSVGENVSSVYKYESPGSFAVTCNGDNCSLISDATWDACRKVVFENSGKRGGLQICHKGDSRYEVYYQELHPDFNTPVCVNGYCVNDMQGYNSFTI